MAAKQRKRHVQEKENHRVPEQHAADGKFRFGKEKLFHLLGRKLLIAWKNRKRQEPLDDYQAYEAEKNEDDEVRPGPGDLQVRGIFSVRWKHPRLNSQFVRMYNHGGGRIRLQNSYNRLSAGFRGRDYFLGRLRGIFEQIHCFPFLAARGQPAVSAAATKGRRSSW